LELEFAQERKKCARLERELQRAKAEVEPLTRAKRKLENAARRVKER